MSLPLLQRFELFLPGKVPIKSFTVGCQILYPASTSDEPKKEFAHSDVYGYEGKGHGFTKRDKTTPGLLKIGFVQLPERLKKPLDLLYQRHPRKRLIEDALHLSRHLRNRGRPVNSTWAKYKANMKSKAQVRSDGKQFVLGEAKEEGLVKDESTKSISADDGLPNFVNEKQAKKPQLTEYSMISYGPRESAAYAAVQLPSVFGSTLRAFHEINKRLPEYAPKSLLDFGSGTGMSVWAAHEAWKGSIKEYQCVDVSEHMNSIAEFLLRGGSNDINQPLLVPGVYFKRFLPLSNRIKYDVVVASYALTEMPFRSQRYQAIKSLWNKTNDFLVLVEPGNNEGFDTVLQARRYITEGFDNEVFVEEGQLGLEQTIVLGEDKWEDAVPGHIFAPCPHELTCARTFVETRDHPCNFAQKVELSFAQKNTALKRYSYFSEMFSFIIFKKGEKKVEDVSHARVLQPVKKKTKHVICELCCSNGNIEKHVLTKGKDPLLYKAARHCISWGDTLPADSLKRPMNIRRPIPPKDCSPSSDGMAANADLALKTTE